MGFVCCALNFLALFCLLAGLDASAQTTSHELTIPNDVSIVIVGVHGVKNERIGLKNRSLFGMPCHPKA